MTWDDNNTLQVSRLWNLLLYGTIVMLFAEVLASASSVWFVDIIGLVLTFPLYLAHGLFYYNLAKRTHRQDIRMLYFWGMYFALYEAPITKVLFAGYFKNEPIMGLVAGIAIFEFVTLVFYWHPIQSFIIPVLFFEYFAFQSNPEEWRTIPDSHKIFFLNTRRNKVILTALLLVFSSFLPFASGSNVLLVLASFGGNVFLIFLFKRMATRNGKKISTNALLLGRRGFIMLVAYLLLLYFFLGAFMLEERWPIAWQPYFVLALVILVIGIIIWKKGGTEMPNPKLGDPYSLEIMPPKGINRFFLGLIFFSSLYSLVSPLGATVAIVGFLLIPLIGILLLGTVLKTYRK